MLRTQILNLSASWYLVSGTYAFLVVVYLAQRQRVRPLS